MLHALALAAMIVVASLSSTFCAPEDVDRDIYVGQNERILDALPPLHELELVEVRSTPYEGALCDLCPRYIAGYRTDAKYRVPVAVTHEHVLWHYASLLDGWDFTAAPLPFPWLDRAAAYDLFGDAEGFMLIATRRQAQVIIEMGLPNGQGYDDGLVHVSIDFQYTKSTDAARN